MINRAFVEEDCNTCPHVERERKRERERERGRERVTYRPGLH